MFVSVSCTHIYTLGTKNLTLHILLIFRYFHQKTYDVAIVGGGIVGLATAKELKARNSNLKCIVLEKEDKLGTSCFFLQKYGKVHYHHI